MNGIDHVDDLRRHLAGDGQRRALGNGAVDALVNGSRANVKGSTLVLAAFLMHVKLLAAIDRTPIIVVDKVFLHGSLGVLTVYDIFHCV